MKDKYGILGYPLGHSLSPYMHSRYNFYLNNGSGYDAYEIASDDLESSLKELHTAGVKGLNVTIPYKQAVIPYLSSMDESAAIVGAVNTLKYTAEGYIGYNTDVTGLRNCLIKNGLELKGRNVLILGAGGAARAAAYVAVRSGCKSLYILNRKLEKAGAVCRDFGGSSYDYSCLNTLPDTPFFVFQTTSVGMYPHIEDMLPLPDEMLNRFEAAVDLIYNPMPTRFLEKLSQRGIKTVTGFDMLIEQGLASRSIWNPEEKISDDIKRKVYDECVRYSRS